MMNDTDAMVQQLRRGLDGPTLTDRFAAAFDEVLIDQYAKNSPGQLGLFGDGLGGARPLRSPKVQKGLFTKWDEQKHPRDTDGKFTDKQGGGAPGKSVSPSGKDKKPKKPFVYPNGQTQDFGQDARPASKQQEGAKPAKPKDGTKEKPKETPAQKDEEKSSDGQLFSDPPEDANPREAAEHRQKQLDDDYEFARKSDVPNAGEDLKGSARHKVNEWRSLAEAEKDGSAAKLVTRDKLLKNETPTFTAHAHKAPLTALAMHLAMKSFPKAPGSGVTYYRPDEEQAKKDREHYLEAYRRIKSAAEREVMKGQNDATDSMRSLNRAIVDEVQRLRETDSRYNTTANSLVSMHRKLRNVWNKTSIPRQVAKFKEMADTHHADLPPADRAEAVTDKVMSVLEGKSIDAAFGKKGDSKKRFNPADMYVGHAAREGGPEMPADTATAATDYLVNESGFRGVQFGNSVTDDERRHHATMAAAAMLDLADITGLPLDAVGLNGKLGLAIGARGKGGALAHYEPGTKVINLTRKNGVGSLAHEWAHAFDHEMGGGNVVGDSFGESATFLSESRSLRYTRMEDKSIKLVDHSGSPLGKAMAEVRSQFRDSGYDDRLSTELRSKGISNRKYWKSNTEMFARCFERYIQNKIEKAGRKNTYLSGIETKAYKSGGLWPTDEEVEKMAPAFDGLMDAYRKHRLGVDERVKYSAEFRRAWIERQVAREMETERYSRPSPARWANWGLTRIR